MRTVLIVAAEAMELAGLLKRCGPSHSLGWGLGFSRAAECNGQRWLLVAQGPGKLAAEAVAIARKHARLDAVVSTGVCGALDPALEVGEVFVASTVRGGEETFGAALPDAAREFRCGVLMCAAGVVSSVEEKRRLHQAGAGAVEMEAAWVAGQARELGLPFYCVRAVMDRADEGFSLDFDRLRGSDGRFSRSRILGAALAHPWAALPELIRLARQSRKAAGALGEFLAECRF